MNKFIVLYLVIATSLSVKAQTTSFSGKVLSDTDQKPLLGVSVTIKGSALATLTDFDGSFTISAKSGQTLVFSYLGFQQKEIILADTKTNLTVVLKEASDQLEEVLINTIATGYGRQALSKVSGAVAAVGEKSINKLAPLRAEEALQGSAAGVQVIGAGAPGAKPTVFIRGITSNGGNAPLVVIDGVPQTLDDLNALSPYDIAKIDVLKDAATAAIYGVTGGNGVILVTTKSGNKEQAMKLRYNGFLGIQSLNRFIPVLNGPQYATILNEASINAGGDAIFHNIKESKSTNWQKELFRTAKILSHNVSVNGGGKSSTYFMSLGYNDTRGIMGIDDKSFFKRINLSSKFKHELNDQLQIVLQANYANLTESGLNEIFNALNFDPTLSVRDEQGSYSISKNITQEVVNPLLSMQNNYNLSKINKLFGKLSLYYQPIKGLKLTSRLGYVFAGRKGKNFTPLQFYGIGHNRTNANKDLSPIVTTKNGKTNRTYSSVTEDVTHWFNINYELFAAYSYEINQHHFDILAGGSIARNTSENVSASAKDVPENAWEFASVGAAKGDAKTQTSGSWNSVKRNLSFFGRLNYDYKGKYLASVTVRRDGSTSFGKKNKFGTFPSASFGWVVSKEDFFEVNAINWLKLRLSYGVLGNDNITPQFPRISNFPKYTFSGNITSGSKLDNISNDSVSWERQLQTNAGMDLKILNETLGLQVDLFEKKVNNLLFTPTLSPYLGTPRYPSANVGSTRSIGVDLVLSYQNTLSDKINIDTNVNFTMVRNSVLSINNGDNFIWLSGYGTPYKNLTRFEQGKEPGYFYGHKTDGIFQNQQEIDNHAKQEGAVPGDIRFVDINGDGIIDDKDRTNIGSPYADFTLGWNLNLQVSDFDFSLATYASVGGKIYRAYERNLNYTNRFASVLNRWTGEGTSDKEPRVSFIDSNQNTRPSDRYVEDGSFFKVKSVQLGACNYVDFDPKETYQTVANDYFKKPSDYQDALVGVYDPLQWMYLNILIGDIASDNSLSGGESATDILGLQEIDDYRHAPRNAVLLDLWKRCYEEKRLMADDSGTLKRATKEAVYAQIEADLKNAIKDLPVSVSEKGRVTKSAAQALLGKIYLYQNKFDLAATTLENVIGVYNLTTAYNTIFTSAGENNQESVFEIQHSNASNWWDWGCMVCSEGNIGVVHNGPRGYSGPEYASGWSFNVPTKKLYNAYEAGDTRRKATILDIEAFKAEQATKGKKVAYFKGYKHTGYYNHKYITRAGASGAQLELNYQTNYRAIRYADVLLMAAEAHNRKSSPDDTKAKEYLNQVRRRAFGVSNNSKDINHTGTDLTKAIWKERQLELAMEGHRFFDLVRTGQASKSIKGFKKGKHEVFPIPLEEIEISEEVLKDTDFLNSTAVAENLKLDYTVSTDNKGKATFSPSANGVLFYTIDFGDGTPKSGKIKPGDQVSHNYAEGNYKVTLNASNVIGKITSKKFDINVVYKAPQNVKVVLENDPNISRKVNITVTADFAKTYEVYFGEAGKDNPLKGNIGETVSYTYGEEGTYSARIVVKGAAKATTTVNKQTQPKNISQPVSPAPTPTTRNANNYISIYSDTYTSIAGVNTFPDWGQAGQGSNWSTFKIACQQEVFKMPPLKNPENLSVTVKIKGTSESQPNGDGSGEVTFTAKADNAITYQFLSGSEEQLFPSGTLTHTFYEVGTKEYNIQILAKGAGGATVGTTKKIKVRVDYTPPADLLQILHGDNQRVWRIKNEVAGHLGVGPADKKNPIWWSANPNDKQNKGVYDDRITFKKDGSFTYQTNGSAFGKKGAMDTDFPSIAALGLAGNSGDYENVPLAAFGGRWVLTAPQGQETLTLSNKEKEVSPPPPEKEKVKKISNLRLLITIKGKTTAKPYGDGSGKISVNATATNAQKYTFSFSTGDVIENTTGRTDYTFKHSGKKDYTVSVIATSSTGHSQIMRKKITIHKGYQLIWADEFNTDGKPDTTRWTYDIGTGSNGWGNNEAQYYTDRTTNVTVKDGLLKITAKKESLKGKYYTSARIKTQGPSPKKGDASRKYQLLKKGLVGAMLNVTGAKNIYSLQKIAVEQSRLGIPLLVGLDVIHGYQTQMPIPLATSSSWDLEAIKKSANIAAVEASAAGINWTFAPMVDISRDARWGRVMEGAGEDPYLGSLIAKAQVQGFQGSDLSKNNTIAACAKHFAGYGFAESGRDYNTVDIGMTTLYNTILPPFKAAKEAGVQTFMNAFNEIDGVPATGSTFLQRKILKKKWGFKGFVVSDWGSIGEMVNHGYALDNVAAAKKAVQAGSDMDMESDIYIKYLEKLVRSGEVPEEMITDAARRILTVKFNLGLFENPYKYCDTLREKKWIGHPSHIKASLEIAKKSVVLLKNQQQLLPLKKNGLRIALIGDLAADKQSPLGNWSLAAKKNSAVDILSAMKAYPSKNNITYHKGVRLMDKSPSFVFENKINTTDTKGISQAVRIAQKNDVVVIVLGEHGFMSGEARSRSELGLPGLQQQLLEAVYKVNKNIVLVLMNGRPLILDWADKHIPAILETWHLGSQSGNAITQILYGDYNPSGKLTMSFPRSVGQLPLYYNHKRTGRPTQPNPDVVFWSHYTDTPNTALYPFGYGLSYTKFKYDNLQLSSHTITPSKPIELKVRVSNTGNYDGEEVVQLYIHDKVASITRPATKYKGFFQHGVYATIEHKTYENTIKDLGPASLSGDEEEEMVVTERLQPVKPPPPPPPPPPPEIIEIVKDDEEIVETIFETTETEETEAIEVEQVVDADEGLEIEEDVPFAIIQEVPIFPGCKGNKAELKNCFIKKIRKHVNRKFDAGLAEDLGLTPGRKRIAVLFKIDKTGKVTEVMARAPHPRLKKEAERTISSLPKMIPGKQHNRPVAVKYSLPITFIVE
uniref:beta-glucosidase n=1 Tax=Stylophora pistillata TaxID=50429 RepID=A0A2B4RXX3_STYPI